MKKILPISTIVFWILFLWVDKLWNEVIKKAVVEQLGTYGELFGPLSFFRPIILYLALTLTICLMVIYIRRNKDI